MIRANIKLKASKDELIPQSEVVITKVITLSSRNFYKFINNILDDYSFIIENQAFMYQKSNIDYCLFVISEKSDFGILVNSRGYTYARYAAYLSKADYHHQLKNEVKSHDNTH